MFWVNFAIYALLLVLIVACPLMCLVIMMQRSKQEGLGAAFGGGFTESIWGAQTSQVLVKATTVAAILFFVLSVGLARLSSHRAALDHHDSGVQLELEKAAAAAHPTVAPASTNAAPVIAPATKATTNAPSAVAPVPAK